MSDVGSQAPEPPDERPSVPLLRDPPPPPGYTNPLEQSDVLEDPFNTTDDA
jgi:hypothetical protein